MLLLLLLPKYDSKRLLLLLDSALGSPSDKSGSELRSFPHWNAAFPRWPPLDLRSLVPRLSSPGVALLEVGRSCSLSASIYRVLSAYECC